MKIECAPGTHSVTFAYKEGTSLFGNTDEILTEENLSRVFHVPVIQLEKKMNGKTYHSLIAVSENESI